VFSIESDRETELLWPYKFRLLCRFTIGSVLKVELIVSNPGTAPFRFEEALHTYFQVGEAGRVRLNGLDGVHFLDNTDANREKIQDGDLVFRGKTDNAYLNTGHAVDLIDPELNRRIRTSKENSLSTITWNPWEDGAREFADLGESEWRHMACVEAANIGAYAITVSPGQEHRMAAIVQTFSNGD
jgi:glucose-6-phosphate 1-epimerase